MHGPTAADILKHAGLGSPSAASSAEGGSDADDPALDAAMEEFQKHFQSGDRKKALRAFKALKDLC